MGVPQLLQRILTFRPRTLSSAMVYVAPHAWQLTFIDRLPSAQLTKIQGYGEALGSVYGNQGRSARAAKLALAAELRPAHGTNLAGLDDGRLLPCIHERGHERFVV